MKLSRSLIKNSVLKWFNSLLFSHHLIPIYIFISHAIIKIISTVIIVITPIITVHRRLRRWNSRSGRRFSGRLFNPLICILGLVKACARRNWEKIVGSGGSCIAIGSDRRGDWSTAVGSTASTARGRVRRKAVFIRGSTVVWGRGVVRRTLGRIFAMVGGSRVGNTASGWGIVWMVAFGVFVVPGTCGTIVSVASL